MATGEVRQAGPALHPARGIRISQRFSDVRKVGPSDSLLANAALLPLRRSLGPALRGVGWWGGVMGIVWERWFAAIEQGRGKKGRGGGVGAVAGGGFLQIRGPTAVARPATRGNARQSAEEEARGGGRKGGGATRFEPRRVSRRVINLKWSFQTLQSCRSENVSDDFA